MISDSARRHENCYILFIIDSYFSNLMGDSEGVVGCMGSTPVGKSQVVIGFLKTLVRTPFEKQLDLGSICFSREVRTALCEIR